MPEEFWLQVEAAHLSGKQPAFIQAAAAENLIQMTSSFLPSDLSGILFYSIPPSPCSSPSQSLCSSLNAHPAILSLCIFLSPCLPFQHTSSCPPTPHSLRLLSLLPRALFRGRLNITSRSSDSSSATQKLCWVAPRYRCCDCTHLAATLITSHPKTNGSLATATGDWWLWMKLSFILHLLDDWILMVILAGFSSTCKHRHKHTEDRVGLMA